MKLVILSDTHIPERAKKLPDVFLKKVKGADLILHAGDLVNLRVLEELKRLAPVKAVWGNMDPLEVRHALKEKELIKIDDITIGLMHGKGHPNYLIEGLKHEFKNDNVDIIVFGHAHKPINKKVDNVLFFNPGSLTDTFFSECLSYGIIEIEKDKFKARIQMLSK